MCDAQDVVQFIRGNFDVVHFLESQLFGAVTHNFGESFVQTANTTFIGVLLDNGLNGGHGYFQMGFGQARLIEVFGQQVTLADLDFFFQRVPTHIDDFHAVPQCGLNGAEVVASGEEHDLT